MLNIKTEALLMTLEEIHSKIADIEAGTKFTVEFKTDASPLIAMDLIGMINADVVELAPIHRKFIYDSLWATGNTKVWGWILRIPIKLKATSDWNRDWFIARVANSLLRITILNG